MGDVGIAFVFCGSLYKNKSVMNKVSIAEYCRGHPKVIGNVEVISDKILDSY